MTGNYEIKTVDATNVHETGFFCCMSKKKEPGYKQKYAWLRERFTEGMKIKILHVKGGRDTAFIEYISGEYAWRAINADGYMVIHCLWVVGKGKGKGYGRRLVEDYIKDARTQGMQGVAMITSDHVWLAGKEIFLQNGFQQVDHAPPCFQLMVTRFGKGPEIGFPGNWEKRARAFGPGLTVIRNPQCPYIEKGANGVLTFAREKGIPARTVELRTARQVQEQSPSAYAVFGIVLDGKLLAYHYLSRREFDKPLIEAKQEKK